MTNEEQCRDCERKRDLLAVTLLDGIEGFLCPNHRPTLVTDQPGRVRPTLYEAEKVLGLEALFVHQSPDVTVTAHMCRVFDPTCWRCDMSADEVEEQSLASHAQFIDPDGTPLTYCASCYQDWPCRDAVTWPILVAPRD